MNSLYIDAIVRQVILGEVVNARYHREALRQRAMLARTNIMGATYDGQADGYTVVIRALGRVLDEIRWRTARQAADDLDIAAKAEARLEKWREEGLARTYGGKHEVDPEPLRLEQWAPGELCEAFGR